MKSEGQRVILIKPDDMIMKTGFKKEKIGTFVSTSTYACCETDVHHSFC